MHDQGRIGKRLAAIREYRFMSQAELAQAIGVSKGLIAHYEHGRAEIGASRLQQLATALHCRAADLLAPLDAPLPRARFRGGPAHDDAQAAFPVIFQGAVTIANRHENPGAV
jgi:transcriptional regulator with XRE-family HTH domain